HYRFLRKRNRRLRLLTVCPDVGLVDIGDANYPMTRTRLSIDRMIRKASLQGLGMLDLALFCPGRGLPEHLAHIHAHYSIFFDADVKLRIKDWERILAPVGGNHNKLGGKIVRIKSKGSKKRPHLTRDHVAGLGWYMT